MRNWSEVCQKILKIGINIVQCVLIFRILNELDLVNYFL